MTIFPVVPYVPMSMHSCDADLTWLGVEIALAVNLIAVGLGLLIGWLLVRNVERQK